VPRLSIDSPFGRLTLTETDGRITALAWGGAAAQDSSPVLGEAARRLAAYFAGELRVFDLPLAPQGAPVEQRVWQAMAAIPYGETRSYGELGRELGLSARAIGAACGRNPLPILLPCHRVVGSGGTLVGYSGGAGIETKRRLLQLERALLL
jgi:methylated-DNA-[protein]-cysteine S-methyltransferase